jgi:Proto-chlorophyllide reductase 57 kD subunit
MEWTPDAEARLKEIPFFVRPAARKKIEKFAQAANATQITAEIYEQAKQKFGAKDEPFNLAPLPALPILCSVNIGSISKLQKYINLARIRDCHIHRSYDTRR